MDKGNLCFEGAMSCGKRYEIVNVKSQFLGRRTPYLLYPLPFVQLTLLQLFPLSWSEVLSISVYCCWTMLCMLLHACGACVLKIHDGLNWMEFDNDVHRGLLMAGDSARRVWVRSLSIMRPSTKNANKTFVHWWGWRNT